MQMKRVLLTGISGTGKSTLIRELAALGYKAIDADYDGWSHYVPAPDDAETGTPGQDWVWREDRIQRLLATEDAEVLFMSGCASNQARFYPQFDHIVLLSAPIELIKERLATRTDNPFGKHPDELARILGHKQTVEPRLRKVATLEIDTSAPLDQILTAVLQFVRPDALPADRRVPNL